MTEVVRLEGFFETVCIKTGLFAIDHTSGMVDQQVQWVTFG